MVCELSDGRKVSGGADESDVCKGWMGGDDMTCGGQS